MKSVKSTSLFVWEKQVNEKSNVSSILLVIRLCINFVQFLDIATGSVIKGINSESAKVQTPESRSFFPNLIGKEINTRYSFSAAKGRWNATHIPLCVWWWANLIFPSNWPHFSLINFKAIFQGLWLRVWLFNHLKSVTGRQMVAWACSCHYGSV